MGFADKIPITQTDQWRNVEKALSKAKIVRELKIMVNKQFVKYMIFFMQDNLVSKYLGRISDYGATKRISRTVVKKVYSICDFYSRHCYFFCNLCKLVDADGSTCW